MKKENVEELSFEVFSSIIKSLPTVHESHKRKSELKKLFFNYLSKPRPGFVGKDTKTSFTKDKTKFLFNDQRLGKGRLALSIIKKFAKDNNPSLEELQMKFPDNLFNDKKGSLGLVRELSMVEVDKLNRFFHKKEDVIITKDGKKAVINSQFSINNINPVIKQAKKFGYKVEVAK